MKWYWVTKYAADRRRRELGSALKRHLEPPFEPSRIEDFEAECRRIDADYRATILGAWAHHRPQGPLDGEVVPREVARLLAEES